MPSQTQAVAKQTPITIQVSSPKAYLSFSALPTAITIEGGVGDYEKKISIGVPVFIQKINGVLYGVVNPYFQWGFNKLFIKKKN